MLASTAVISWPIRLPPPRHGGVDVLAFGENSLDFVGVGPRVPEGADKISLSSFAQLVGGQAATAAVGCARQGWRARYAGSFGDDDAGARVRKTLSSEGVDVLAVTRAGIGSRVAMILVDEATGARSVFEYRHPRLQLARADIDTALVSGARVVMLDATHPDASIALAEAAQAARVPIVIDIDRAIPDARRLMSLAPVLVVPEAFASSWTGHTHPEDAIDALAREFDAPVTVVTLGAGGSLANVGGRAVRTPAFPVQALDTTGAGDAFRAGLVCGWLGLGTSADAAAILAHANATAALNCTAPGALAGLPSRAATEALVTRRWHDQSK
jgi:sugar/nucleoside kinase (ribokinase family)